MPEKLTLESAAKDRQWVFPLLTLDVVRPFYDLVGLTQEAHAGLQYVFWAWLLRGLTPQQQTKLREKALEIVQTDKLAWIKDLVPLSALDIGL